MSDEPLAREREPIERVRARLEALVMANAAPRCGARSKRTGKPCRAAAMPNGRCKVHGGKSTGPRTPEGLERSRRANWKHGYYSRETLRARVLRGAGSDNPLSRRATLRLERKASGGGRAGAHRQAPLRDDGDEQERPLRPYDRRPVQAHRPEANQHVRLRQAACL